MPKCETCKYHCDKCDEIARTRNSDGPSNHCKNDTICWCCTHAVPSKGVDGKYITGCEWSLKHRIPLGAKTIPKKTEVVRYDKSGHRVYISGGTVDVIVSCPKFKRG